MIKNTLFILFCFFSLPCLALLSSKDLTLEEKVGQILIVHFHGDTLTPDANTLIKTLHVGGIIYYTWANGLTSPSQVSHLSASLQHLAKIPLLICTDQEGGPLNRLSQGFTLLPSNKAVGMTGNPLLAEECAFAIGQELLSVGINMNLAPVVDINSHPRNPIIGVRSFGSTPEIVTQFGEKALKGYHKAGLITSLKHFPGHGDVSVDSHEELPILNKTLEALKAHELLPFASLAKDSDTIMTAHIKVPALDPLHCATLSKPILTLLRQEVGFKGVILSDSLIMKALFTEHSSIEQIAIHAFNAGCDMLILGGKLFLESDPHDELTLQDVVRIHQSLIQAVKQGVISEARLNEAVDRILALKSTYLLSPLHKKELISFSEHEDLANTVAAAALRMEKYSLPYSLSVKDSTITIYAPTIVKKALQTSSFLTSHPSLSTALFTFSELTEEENKNALQLAKASDLLLFFSYNAWKSPPQQMLIQELLNIKKPFILVALRDPLDIELFPSSDVLMTTFDPTPCSIKAVYNCLIERNP
jgi:beta-N-acetylhexosaminidase